MIRFHWADMFRALLCVIALTITISQTVDARAALILPRAEFPLLSDAVGSVTTETTSSASTPVIFYPTAPSSSRIYGTESEAPGTGTPIPATKTVEVQSSGTGLPPVDTLGRVTSYAPLAPSIVAREETRQPVLPSPKIVYSCEYYNDKDILNSAVRVVLNATDPSYFVNSDPCAPQNAQWRPAGSVLPPDVFSLFMSGKANYFHADGDFVYYVKTTQEGPIVPVMVNSSLYMDCPTSPECRVCYDGSQENWENCKTECRPAIKKMSSWNDFNVTSHWSYTAKVGRGEFEGVDRGYAPKPITVTELQYSTTTVVSHVKRDHGPLATSLVGPTEREMFPRDEDDADSGWGRIINNTLVGPHITQQATQPVESTPTQQTPQPTNGPAKETVTVTVGHTVTLVDVRVTLGPMKPEPTTNTNTIIPLPIPCEDNGRPGGQRCGDIYRFGTFVKRAIETGTPSADTDAIATPSNIRSPETTTSADVFATTLEKITSPSLGLDKA